MQKNRHSNYKAFSCFVNFYGEGCCFLGAKICPLGAGEVMISLCGRYSGNYGGCESSVLPLTDC